jgi:hypothetical protein
VTIDDMHITRKAMFAQQSNGEGDNGTGVERAQQPSGVNPAE